MDSPDRAYLTSHEGEGKKKKEVAGFCMLALAEAITQCFSKSFGGLCIKQLYYPGKLLPDSSIQDWVFFFALQYNILAAPKLEM